VKRQFRVTRSRADWQLALPLWVPTTVLGFSNRIGCPGEFRQRLTVSAVRLEYR